MSKPGLLINNCYEKIIKIRFSTLERCKKMKGEMKMNFSDFKTDGFMYVLAIVIILFVIADSLFFLIRAWRRGKQLGMDTKVMKATMVQAGLFSLPAALSIVMTIVALSGALGIVLPWIRLSVIGSVTYEVPAATTAVEALGIKGGLASEITSKAGFATAAWVMTTGSVLPLVFVPIATKKIQTIGGKAENKNSALTGILTGAAFIGLMTAFTAQAITGTGDKAVLGDGAGVMSLISLLVSMLVMFILTKITKKHPNHWLESLSMPIAMFSAMIVVIILGQLLPTEITLLEWRY